MAAAYHGQESSPGKGERKASRAVHARDMYSLGMDGLGGFSGGKTKKKGQRMMARNGLCRYSHDDVCYKQSRASNEDGPYGGQIHLLAKYEYESGSTAVSVECCCRRRETREQFAGHGSCVIAK